MFCSYLGLDQKERYGNLLYCRPEVKAFVQRSKGGTTVGDTENRGNETVAERQWRRVKYKRFRSRIPAGGSAGRVCRVGFNRTEYFVGITSLFRMYLEHFRIVAVQYSLNSKHEVSGVTQGSNES
jgi:hypothetical protein